MSLKFKPGDRVVVVTPPDFPTPELYPYATPGQVFTILKAATPPSFYKDRYGNAYYADKDPDGYVLYDNYAVLEEIYNSTLYKALKDDE